MFTSHTNRTLDTGGSANHHFWYYLSLPAGKKVEVALAAVPYLSNEYKSVFKWQTKHAYSLDHYGQCWMI